MQQHVFGKQQHWLGNILIGLLACWVFAVRCLFSYFSLLRCVLAREFLDVILQVIFLALAVPRYSYILAQ